uniref:Secreted protein n=1 Tax=Romanomermis culicivorax TaxID=13658 RepID=A0A915KI11_ROMCU
MHCSSSFSSSIIAGCFLLRSNALAKDAESSSLENRSNACTFPDSKSTPIVRISLPPDTTSLPNFIELLSKVSALIGTPRAMASSYM